MSAFVPGDLILLSKPYAYVLNNVLRGKRCDNCFKKNSSLKRCSQCSFVYFCNKNCQRELWNSHHKEECIYIKDAKPKEPTASMRLIALILFKIKKYGVDEPTLDIYGRKVSFETLMSHVPNITQNTSTCAQMHAMLSTLKTYIGNSNIPSVDQFIEVFGKMCINTFSICDSEMQSIGSGLYLGASVFDHSCQPDAEVVFDGIDLNVRAVRDIPHKDISKIFISYIEQLQLTEDRKKELREQYYFECQCPRCASPIYDEMMKALIVDKDITVMLSNYELQIEHIKQHKKDGANPRMIYELAWKELETISQVAANTHIFKIKLLELAFDAAIETSNFVDALAIGKELIKPYKTFYGPYHPMIGIHFFKIGKLENFLGKFELSKKHLLEAEDNLRVTHGKSHPLYHDLLGILHETSSRQEPDA